MADRWSDAALAKLPPRPADADAEKKALVEEARLRAHECWVRRQSWFDQCESDREFLETQFTDRQRRYRESTNRPTIEIHLLHTRIEQVMHDWRTADVGFRVGSAVGKGGQAAARMFNGLAARDQRDGGWTGAMQAVVRDAASLGEGWGKLVVVREDGTSAEGEPLWDGRDWSIHAALGVMDRRVRFEHVPPEDVWPDPHAMRDDRSDMEWLIETRWMTREKRDQLWPDAHPLEPTNFGGPARFRGQEWFRGSGEGPARDQMVRVALYWRRVQREMDYVWLPEWKTAVRADRVTAEQQAQMAASPLAVIVEKQETTTVELSVIDGATVLAGPTRMPMTRIPYFRSVNTEVRYGTGELVPRGLVALLRGPSKWMTVSASDAAWKQSTVGLNFMTISREALEGNEEDWENVADPSLIRVVNEWEQLPAAGQDRKQLRAPQWTNAEAGLDDDIRMTETIRNLAGMVGGAADSAQRAQSESARSGVAIDRLDRMGATNRSAVIYNAQHTMVQAASEIWLDVVRNVMSRRGRVIQVASETPGEPDEGVIVGVPFFRDADTGEPVPAPPLLSPHVDRIPLMLRDANGEYQVAEGNETMRVHRFNPRTDRVMVSTFSSGLTRLGADAKAEYIGQLLASPASQQIAPALLMSAAKAVSDVIPMDDVIRALEPLQAPGVEDDLDVSTLVGRFNAATAENQQLRQQLEQATAAADQTAALKEIEQMKAQMRAASAEAVATIRAETAGIVAQLRADTARYVVDTETEQRREQVMVEQTTAAETESEKNEAKAVVEGMKAGAKGASDARGTGTPAGG